MRMIYHNLFILPDNKSPLNAGAEKVFNKLKFENIFDRIKSLLKAITEKYPNLATSS